MALFKTTANRIATYVMAAMIVLVVSQCVSAQSLQPIKRETPIVVDGQTVVVINGHIVWVEVSK